MVQKYNFFAHVSGSEFVCSSSLSIGDALAKAHSLDSSPDSHEQVTLTAKTIRQDMKSANQNDRDPLSNGMDFSSEFANKMVPNTLYNFCIQLLSDKDIDISQGKPVGESSVHERLL